MVVVVVGRESPTSSASAELPASLAFSANSASSDCSRSRVDGRSSVRVCMRRVGAAAGRQRPDRRGRLLRRGGLDRCSRSRRSSGSGGRRPRSAVAGGAAVRIGACMQSAVACTGKELETYVKRAGCVAFLPGPWLCCGCAVRSSGSSCSGRFDCTCVVGGCDQSARWRRIRRARGKLGAGIGAPAPADAGWMPCRDAPSLLPWWPFRNRPLMLGARRGAGWRGTKG